MQIDLLKYAERHKKLFCYGAGHFGKVIRIFLDEHGIMLNGFIVSISQERGSVLDVPVFGIDDALKESDIGVFVGVGKNFKDEIVAELESRGYSDYFVAEESDLCEIEQLLTFKNTYPTNGFVCVLYYHRICDITRDTWKLAVPPDLFKEHVQFLKENYNILRFEDDWQDVHEQSVVITFDDGYADNYENAFPILEQYEVPATVFVCTEPEGVFWSDILERLVHDSSDNLVEFFFAGQKFSISTPEEKEKACYALHPYFKAMLPKQRQRALRELAVAVDVHYDCSNASHRLLSEKALRALSESPFVTIGGHTMTHTALAVEPIDLQREEIRKSKEHIESVIGKTIDVFSYPFGSHEDFTSETETVIRECGYKKAATTISGLADNASAMQIPRVWIPGRCSLARLRHILLGAWYL